MTPLALLAGCSSMALEDAAPTTESARTPTYNASRTQPDGYPNLNFPVRGATAQLTESERQQMLQDLAASRNEQGDGADPAQAAAEGERLRRLGRTHASERLKAIEATQQ